MIYILLDAVSKRYPKGNVIDGIAELEAAVELKDAILVNHLANFLSSNPAQSSYVDESKRPGFGKVLGQAIVVDDSESLDMARILLDHGADPNELFYGRTSTVTAFLQAIETKSIRKTCLLLRQANINLPANMGFKRTPIQLAAERGDKKMVSFLLSKGADPRASAALSWGTTALQLAAIGGYIGIVEILLQEGARVEEPPAVRNGRIAFEGAAEHGRFDMLSFLAHHGALWADDAKQQVQRALKFAERNKEPAAMKFILMLCEDHGLELEGITQ